MLRKVAAAVHGSLSPLRCVLFSSTRFGAACAHALAALPGLELVGIVTTAKRIRTSYAPKGIELVTHHDFLPWAAERGVPAYCEGETFRPRRCAEWLGARGADLLLVLGWHFLLPQRLRQLAAKGAAGVHASLLPKYRGGAPLVWAIINGEKQVGATFFYLNDGVDDGDVIGQALVPVTPEDTIATVYSKVTAASVDLLKTMLPRVADGSAPRLPQDRTQASIYPQRSPADGEIDWNQPAARIHDFVRAQTKPYPGAFTWLAGEKVTIWRTRPVPERGGGRPGSWRAAQAPAGGLEVRCGDDSSLLIAELESGRSRDTDGLLRAAASLPPEQRQFGRRAL